MAADHDRPVVEVPSSDGSSTILFCGSQLDRRPESSEMDQVQQPCPRHASAPGRWCRRGAARSVDRRVAGTRSNGAVTSPEAALRRSSSSWSTRLRWVRTMTTTPETTSAVASRIPSVSSSRAGASGEELRQPRRGACSRSRDGADQRLVMSVELAAQVADVRLDHVVVAVEVVLPHVVEICCLESTLSELSSR